MRIFDKLLQLHYDTAESDSKRDTSLASLNARMFRNETYIRETHINLKTDVSFKALLVAYIVGMKHLPKSYINNNDAVFYKGVWDLICELMQCGDNIMDPLAILPEAKLYMLYGDVDVTHLDLKKISDKVAEHCIINDIPEYNNRNKVCEALLLPRSWITRHYAIVAYEGRKLPTNKVLQFAFGAYRLAYIGAPEPTPGYWLTHAGYAWDRVQYDMIKAIENAEKHRLRYIAQDLGLDIKDDNKNFRRPTGYLL